VNLWAILHIQKIKIKLKLVMRKRLHHMVDILLMLWTLSAF